MREFIVPGLNGSGPDHWQSWWLRQNCAARRVEQADWDHPVLADWSATLARAVEAEPGAMLIAHSLGAALVVRLAAARPDLLIGGALLVAPVDPVPIQDRVPEVAGFGPLPETPLPFPSLVVASRNDSFIAFDRARELAGRWRSRFVDLGARGHINAESGFGPWPAGMRLACEIAAAAPLQAVAR